MDLETHLETAREWYADRLGWRMPAIQLIALPPNVIEEGVLFVYPFRPANPANNPAFRENYSQIIRLLTTDAEINPHGLLDYEELFEEMYNGIRGLDLSDKQHFYDQYLSKHTSPSIYYSPTIADVFLSQENSATILEAYLVHEMMHYRQDQQDLVLIHPFLREGPAWAIQYLYGADKNGFARFNDMQQELRDCFGEERSSFLQSYDLFIDTGIAVVAENLPLDFENIDEGTYRRFSTVLDQPRYTCWEIETGYRILKAQILIDRNAQ